MMRFDAKVGEMKKALAPCVGIVTDKQIIPILSNVLLSAKSGRTTMTCCNLDQNVVSSADSVVEDEGNVTLNATVLDKFLGGFKNELDCSFTSKDDDIIVKCGKSRATLKTLPVKDFPSFPEGEYVGLNLDGPDIRRAISSVSYAASSDNNIIYLNGVFVSPYGDGVDFVATDGHRLSMYHVETDAKFSPVIIPSLSIKRFLQLIGTDDDDCRLEISKQLVRISRAATSLASKIVDGIFPDYRQLIEVKIDHYATINIGELVSAINVARSMDNENSIRIDLENDQCVICSMSSGIGEIVSVIETEVKKPISVYIKAEFLSDVLRVFEGEEVRIFFNKEKTAAHLLGLNENHHTIIMTRQR